MGGELEDQAALKKGFEMANADQRGVRREYKPSPITAEVIQTSSRG
jgi:hypothetical protein